MTAARKLTYRGVEVDAELAALIRHMPAVDATRETLQALQGVWDSLAILSELSGTGVEIAGIRAAFAALTSTLVNQIGTQARHKAALEQLTKAQVTIDILVRNLFERTADIGFLATDEDLRRFAQAQAGERELQLPALRQRLREYQRKYSVYDDLILLAPNGQVLARLDDTVAIAQTRDTALLEEALQSSRAYVESYRSFDLRPAASRSLVYACRVTSAGGDVIAVLCLCFRFEDECKRIFRKFVGVNDWSVVALLDADGCAIASSDPFQVPMGAHVAAPADGAAHVIRFAGRHWLAVSCGAHPFQGYAGPGWHGHAMTPLEHAFGADGDTAMQRLDADMARKLQASEVLYPQGLRDIARAAQRIEADLARAVWNGNLALTGAAGATGEAVVASAKDASFSRSLLREIGRTGARTREGFTAALAEMSGSIAGATLDGAHACAALAIDIMDRSLYERANDCRWWALTTAFRGALERRDGPDEAQLGRILQTIHGLYTVYANLVLFDRDGRIVAAARSDDATGSGRILEAEWVKRTLGSRDTQAYCVSAFEPSDLYAGRPTYVFAAAVRGLADPSRVVGGIAIVFDSEPQLRSMLQDTLPRDAQGQPMEGAVAVFTGRDGKVIACSHANPALGSLLDLPVDEGAGGGRVVAWRERWYAAGTERSTGYREFKGADDPYREEVAAWVLDPLTLAGAAATAAMAPTVPPMPQRSLSARGASAGAQRVDLATLRIGDQWHAVPARHLVEAIQVTNLLPLPGRADHVRGSVMFRNAAIAVLDADRLLGRVAASPPAQDRQIVVLRPPQGRGVAFGLLVDALGDNPEVAPNQLVRLAEGAWQRASSGLPLIDTVVAPAPGTGDRDLLTLLSVEALAGLLGLS